MGEMGAGCDVACKITPIISEPWFGRRLASRVIQLFHLLVNDV